MAEGGKKPVDLIKNIISFLEREREVFGAFSVSGNPSSELTERLTTDHSTTSNEKRPKREDAHPRKVEQEIDIYERIEDCQTLGELKELCHKAGVLNTDLEGTNLVFGVGNPDADLMLIGEAPGEEEDRQGEPFVGAAGQLLNKILEAVNFKRDEVYIANILKHRPPNNRNPNEEERRRSLPFLLKQIELVNPKLILSLGKVSAQTLLESTDTLGSMRGKFHKFRDKYELLATYHPAALLRHAKWKRPTWEDVQMLRNRYDELGCRP